VSTPEYSSEESHGSRSRNYALAVLFLIYTFSFIDRQILVIIQESIKADLNLSDFQLGILSGLAFAMFYVTAGIPIARWADRANRRNILAGSLTIWSAMTALSGLVGNYAQLVAARIGVGIGEAGCSPPSHSMISSMFPPQKRATALAIYSSGIYFGILLGYLVGGYINELYGWRFTFFVVGLPGVLLAIVLRFTVAEPARQLDPGNDSIASLTESIKSIWQLRSFRYFSLGCAVSAFSSYGVGNFIPSYLYRSHELSIAEIGVALALVSGAGGITGTFLGGYLTDKFGKNDVRLFLWIPGAAALLAMPLYLWAWNSDDTNLVYGLVMAALILNTMYLGPCIAVAHKLVEPQYRALISSILFFVLNLIGLGLGPVFVGALSDYLQTDYGTDGLRYAMSAGSVFAILQAYLFWAGGKLLPGEISQNRRQR